MSIVKRFLDEVYQYHPSDEDLLSFINRSNVLSYDDDNIDWDYYGKKLTAQQLSVFKCFSRMGFCLPRKPFADLITGLKWDIQATCFMDEFEFLQHAKHMSGSTMAALFFIFWNKSGEWPQNFEAEGNVLIQKGSAVGMVNIRKKYCFMY